MFYTVLIQQFKGFRLPTARSFFKNPENQKRLDEFEAPKEAAMTTASSTQMTILGFLSAMFSICNIMQYQLQEITVTIPSPYQDQEVLMSAN